MTSALAGHGLRVELPRRWEGRLYRRETPTGTAADAEAGTGVLAAVRRRTTPHPAALGWAGESTNPVLHLANFALPPGRGDFGTGAVERMAGHHVFVSLLEYDRAEAHRPLFASLGIPRPALADFAANSLQRRLPGQLGRQSFFPEQDRAFCLYVVLGSRAHAAELVGEVHDALDGLRIDSAEVADAV